MNPLRSRLKSPWLVSMPIISHTLPEVFLIPMDQAMPFSLGLKTDGIFLARSVRFSTFDPTVSVFSD